MKTTLCRIISISVLVTAGAAAVANAQSNEPAPARRINFGYSQNPKTKAKKEADAAVVPVGQSTPSVAKNDSEQSRAETPAPVESIARKTLEVVKTANRAAVAPTESYKVGAGDVLFINLQNNAKSSNYYTVLNDGTIDYPLAGEMVLVAGLSSEEIEEMLAARIKLYENPQVSVKVRDFASHKITVLGLVERAGERFIQRDAVPLFVVRAEAAVKAEATRAVVRRADARVENVELAAESADAVLVYPGDIVEFTTDRPAGATGKFFYIGGEVAEVGRKDFYEGLTLTQAILASGGLKKDGVKRVVVRRKNADGLLVPTEYNLRQIKDGKAPDPAIAAGDTIEVGN